MKDLKLVCQAVSRDAAEQALEELDAKCGGQKLARQLGQVQNPGLTDLLFGVL